MDNKIFIVNDCKYFIWLRVSIVTYIVIHFKILYIVTMSYKKKRSKEKKNYFLKNPKKKLTPYFFFESKVDPILNCKIPTQKNK